MIDNRTGLERNTTAIVPYTRNFTAPTPYVRTPTPSTPPSPSTPSQEPAFIPSQLRYAGFGPIELRDFFGFGNTNLGGQKAEALLKVIHKQPLTQTEFDVFKSIDPSGSRFQAGATSPNQGFGDIVWGLNHLQAHPKGSHYGGDFNIVGALDRLFTVRAQSFSLGNIARTAGVVAVATATGGQGVALLGGSGAGVNAGVSLQAGGPLAQSGGQNLFSGTASILASQTKVNIEGVQLTSGTSTHDTSVAQAAATGVYSLGQTQAGNPAERETWYNRIARQVGGAAGAYGLTAGLSSFLSPLTEGAGYGAKIATTTKNIVQTTGTGFYSGQAGQAVLGIFGQKVGGFLLALLGRDVRAAYAALTRSDPSHFVSPTTNQPVDGPNPFGSYGGGGGGGSGLGIAEAKTRLSSIPPLWYAVGGFGVLVALILFLRRK